MSDEPDGKRGSWLGTPEGLAQLREADVVFAWAGGAGGGCRASGGSVAGGAGRGGSSPPRADCSAPPETPPPPRPPATERGARGGRSGARSTGPAGTLRRGSPSPGRGPP